MFKNYLKITSRNFLRSKTYSLLNISGLAIGIASATLIFLWVEDEVNYDHFFQNLDNLYIIKNKQTFEGKTFVFDATPGPLAQAMKNEIPGIFETTRISGGNEKLFARGDKSLYERGFYVDQGFLKMFSVKFIEGNSKNVFSQLYSVVISEKMAKKFFNSTNVIGKTLKVNNKDDYEVSGVFSDLPKNVSVKFDWLIQLKAIESQSPWLQTWGDNTIITIAQVAPGAALSSLNKALYNFVQTKNLNNPTKLMLYPVNRINLYNNFDNNGNEKEGLIKFVRLFTLIAWIILVIACINFMNLATARSDKRSKEVGIKKVLGATRRKLIIQFLSESVLLSFFSLLIGIVIILLALPAFNNLVHKNISLNLFSISHLIGLSAIALICGLVAGSYPSFFLSSFNPAMILKNAKIKNSSPALVRKILVVLQFTSSLILIICTIIIYQQIQYGKEKDLGFKKENLITTKLQAGMNEHFPDFKNYLLKTGVVENACLSDNSVLDMGSNSGGFSWEGKAPDQNFLITTESIGPEYIATHRMHLLEGREFYQNLRADSTNIIINEALAKILNRKNIIGFPILYNSIRYTIIGIVKDFVSLNVYTPTDPLIMFADVSRANVMTIRFKDNADLAGALKDTEKAFKAYYPGYPFGFQFVDETFDQLFNTETLIGKLAGIFAALAIIISCLGLFGLASFTAERRTKEIGIRKVLGASATGITGLLTRGFLRPVMLSVVIAFPVSWWLMVNWLKDYEYRINIAWWVFAIAGLMVLLIAALTVSFQSVKAAVANPVGSLRTD